jgi:hypothetical protein
LGQSSQFDARHGLDESAEPHAATVKKLGRCSTEDVDGGGERFSAATFSTTHH